MTAQELQKIIDPKVEISAKQMQELERMVEDKPWFSCGQLLLLKAMKQHSHPLFTARLAYVSLYTTSRANLQGYLQKVQIIDNQQVKNNAMPVDFAALNDDFELLPFDESCEQEVEIPALALKNDVKKERTARNIQLIDKFLASDMQKIVPRDNAGTEDKALPFGEVPQDLVSETLADVYLAQGLQDKAMQMYGKLSLLYPEKKAYFAARFAAVSQSQRSTAQS